MYQSVILHSHTHKKLKNIHKNISCNQSGRIIGNFILLFTLVYLYFPIFFYKKHELLS